MKSITLLFNLFVFSFAVGQIPTSFPDVNKIFDTSFDWESYETINEKQKILFSKKIYETKNNYCYFYEDSLGVQFYDIFLDLIHLIDVDGDNDLDVIFEGKACSGIESGQIDIYINTNDELKKIKLKGALIVNLDTTTKKLVTFSYPYCAEKIGLVYNYSINKNDSLFYLEETAIIYGRLDYPLQELIPKLVNLDNNFLLKKETNLHWSTNIKDFDEVRTYEIDSINILSKLPADSKGIILGESKDGEWFFVKMNYNNKIQQNCFSNYTLKLIHNLRYYTYGWVLKSDIM